MPSAHDKEWWKEYRKTIPAEVARARHRKIWLARYGLTLDDYMAMVQAQNGVCAICGGVEIARDGTVANFDIDHDHACCPADFSCGKCIRGLLCRRCNLLLGMVKDDANLIDAAAAYLRLTKRHGTR